jgi:hypothetical protein
MGIGLAEGYAAVGNIGSARRMDYTAIGRTTHLAARMEQLASPGSVLVTPSTLELAEGFVSVKSLGRVPVKGLADPLEVHELVGVGLARTRFQAVARRGLTRFVGRDVELEQLRLSQQLALDGHGQVVALVADAGMGKSRWSTNSPTRRAWRVAVRMRRGLIRQGYSYLPVINLLETISRSAIRTALRPSATKLRASCSRLTVRSNRRCPRF